MRAFLLPFVTLETLNERQGLKPRLERVERVSMVPRGRCALVSAVILCGAVLQLPRGATLWPEVLQAAQARLRRDAACCSPVMILRGYHAP